MGSHAVGTSMFVHARVMSSYSCPHSMLGTALLVPSVAYAGLRFQVSGSSSPISINSHCQMHSASFFGTGRSASPIQTPRSSSSLWQRVVMSLLVSCLIGLLNHPLMVCCIETRVGVVYRALNQAVSPV